MSNERERAHILRARLESMPHQLGSPVGEAEIASFEAEAGILLPLAYREFLQIIGNGGDGPPSHGLVTLAQSRFKPSSVADLVLHPERVFPLDGPWIWEDEIDCNDEVGPGVRRMMSVFSDGHLYLGTDGCGMDWILIVSGDFRGEVWNRADVGAQPLNPRRDFLSWYGYWLDGGTDWYSDDCH